MRDFTLLCQLNYVSTPAKCIIVGVDTQLNASSARLASTTMCFGEILVVPTEQNDISLGLTLLADEFVTNGDRAMLEKLGPKGNGLFSILQLSVSSDYAQLFAHLIL